MNQTKYWRENIDKMILPSSRLWKPGKEYREGTKDWRTKEMGNRELSKQENKAALSLRIIKHKHIYLL